MSSNLPDSVDTTLTRPPPTPPPIKYGTGGSFTTTTREGMEGGEYCVYSCQNVTLSSSASLLPDLPTPVPPSPLFFSGETTSRLLRKHLKPQSTPTFCDSGTVSDGTQMGQG